MRASIPAFKRFVGVDLGGGKGRNTALAIIEIRDAQPKVALLAPRAGGAPLYDGLLVEMLRNAAPDALLCVDAPLTLPPCLRCSEPCPGLERCAEPAVVEMNRLAGAAEGSRDARRGKPAVTPYTQRATEVYLHKRRGLLPRETLGQGMGPLTARAVHLVRALRDVYRLHENLLEVYPRATLELLGIRSPYKKRVDARLQILSHLSDLSFAPGVWREECVQSDHVFDAVICAYTGYLSWRDGWRLPTTEHNVFERDGWIWVPPTDEERQQATQAEAPLARSLP